MVIVIAGSEILLVWESWGKGRDMRKQSSLMLFTKHDSGHYAVRAVRIPPNEDECPLQLSKNQDKRENIPSWQSGEHNPS